MFEVGKWVATVNSTYTGGDFAYNNPVIPEGFMPLETADASWKNVNGVVEGWNDGLVIVDGIGNEFVWVPCTKTETTGLITYKKIFDEYVNRYDITQVEDYTNALPMKDAKTQVSEIEQIKNYGGFYIGRYEAGVPDKTGTPTNSEGVPVVQKDATVWTNISYMKILQSSKKLYESSPSVRSGMLTGTAWDTVCAWIGSETDSNGNVKYNLKNIQTWGNCFNNIGNVQNDAQGEKISGKKQTTGKSEYWKAKNIYDFAGNAWEFTAEKASAYYVTRGGCYECDGNSYGANYRDYQAYAIAEECTSFRIMLFVL